MFRTPIRRGLELRLLEERHAPVIFSLVNQDRDYLRAWLPWVDATHAEDDTLAFVRSALEQFSHGDGLNAGIWGREFMGVIGTLKIDKLNHKVEIGYWLGSAFQGQGIMTDACRTVIDYLFRERDLNRIEIQAAAGNTKSAAIPRR